MTQSFYKRQNGHFVFYEQHKQKGAKVGIVYLHGLLSSHNSRKGRFLKKAAKKYGLDYLSFDFTAHGKSWGKPTDWRIGRCLKDAVEVIKAKTDGPQILIGSSMGGWIGLLASELMPRRVAGYIGLATGADFMKNVWENLLTDTLREALQKGVVFGPSEKTNGYCFSYPMFEDAQKYFLLNRPICYRGPVILINGDKDLLVDYRQNFKIQENLLSKDVQTWIVKGSGHNLSTPKDLKTIRRAIEAILEKINKTV